MNLRKLLFPLLAVAIVMAMSACGGGSKSTTPPAITVQISPVNATVVVGNQQQFTATVANAGTTSVIWQVNGVTGGNASVGTISTAGMYTAPAVAPNPNTVTVTAISAADGSTSASATVTIQAKTGMAIAPATASVGAGQTVQFTATVNSLPSTAVNWQVNGVAGGNGTFGTISTSGLYTAPATVPNPANVSVNAVLQADATQTVSADVTITQFSNASLSGPFTFVMQGTDTNGDFTEAGVFTADGKGYITSGTADFSQASTVQSAIPFTGTYGIDSNTGVGTANLTLGSGSTTLAFVMAGPNYAYFIESDQYGNASGSLQKQDATALSTSAITGTYVFTFSGYEPATPGPVAAVGNFVANGNGVISSGSEDINENGTFVQNVPLTGDYTVSANGRGTGHINDGYVNMPFVFYVVDKNTIRLFSSDVTMPAVGRAEKQWGTFSNDAFSGGYVFSSAGNTQLGGIVSLAQFDASGGVTTGTLDETEDGTAYLDATFTGTYGLSANGRATSTITTSVATSTQVAWFVTPARAFMIYGDEDRVQTGVLEQQTSGAFSNASLDGIFGYGTSGYDYTSGVSANIVDASGTITANGLGAFDVAQTLNTNGTVTDAALTGTYAVTANGRGTATLNHGSTLVFYVLNPSKLYMMQTNQDVQVSGNAMKQY